MKHNLVMLAVLGAFTACTAGADLDSPFPSSPSEAGDEPAVVLASNSAHNMEKRDGWRCKNFGPARTWRAKQFRDSVHIHTIGNVTLCWDNVNYYLRWFGKTDRAKFSCFGLSVHWLDANNREGGYGRAWMPGKIPPPYRTTMSSCQDTDSSAQTFEQRGIINHGERPVNRNIIANPSTLELRSHDVHGIWIKGDPRGDKFQEIIERATFISNNKFSVAYP